MQHHPLDAERGLGAERDAYTTYAPKPLPGTSAHPRVRKPKAKRPPKRFGKNKR